jgi:nucleoside-diphosphate-sugar epimerase
MVRAMKIILTGASGFVGGEVLSQLLAHPGVERVTTLGRRPLGQMDERLVERIHEDFLRYDGPLAAELAEHDGCIWSLGGKVSDARSETEYEKVTHDFALAFARAVAASGRPFTFVYVSGMGVDPTGTATFPWQLATRLIKGKTERDLHAVHAEHEGFRALCVRPGGILPRDTGPIVERVLRPIVIRVEVLAAALISLVSGVESASSTVSNREARRIGKAFRASGSPRS